MSCGGTATLFLEDITLIGNPARYILMQQLGARALLHFYARPGCRRGERDRAPGEPLPGSAVGTAGKGRPR